MLYDLFSCGYLPFVPVRFAPNLYALGVRQSGACLVPLFSQARWLAARCDCLYFPIQRKISFDPSRLQVAALLLTYIRTLQRGDLPSLLGIERVPSTVVQYCSSFLQTPLNTDTARSMPFGKHLSTSILSLIVRDYVDMASYAHIFIPHTISILCSEKSPTTRQSQAINQTEPSPILRRGRKKNPITAGKSCTARGRNSTTTR